VPSVESCNIRLKAINYINVDRSVLETSYVLFIEVIKIYLQKKKANELKN
jgi:hypothetical protein